MVEDKLVVLSLKESTRNVLKGLGKKGETYDTIIRKLILDSARLKVIEQNNEDIQKSKSAFNEVIKT